MANFILPNEYFYSDLNNHLIDLQRTHNYLFKKNVVFMGMEANLPFSIWNGGTLINDKFLNQKEIEELYIYSLKPLVINCSNIFISSNDIFNLKENLFLEKYHTGLNYIIISDPNFLLLLKNKFPYYSFILSPYFPPEEITEELINQCVYIMNYYNNINENIPKNKLMIVLPINQTCYKCSNFFYCTKEEQENIYNFKTISQIRDCKYNQKFDLFLFNYLELTKQGYINFIFDDRAFPLGERKLLAHFYADFFGLEGKNQEIFNLLMEG